MRGQGIEKGDKKGDLIVEVSIQRLERLLDAGSAQVQRRSHRLRSLPAKGSGIGGAAVRAIATGVDAVAGVRDLLRL